MRRILTPAVLIAAFVVTIVSLVALAFFLSLSSDGDPEQLRALNADPMARYVPPGARRIGSFETEDGKAIGKSIIADVYREFELPRGAEDGAIDAAARAARAAGWTPQSTTRRAFSGEKRLSTGRAELTILLQDDPVDPPPGTRTPTLAMFLTDR